MSFSTLFPARYGILSLLRNEQGAKMFRFTVVLEERLFHDVQRLAIEERRDLRSQAAMLIAEALDHRSHTALAAGPRPAVRNTELLAVG